MVVIDAEKAALQHACLCDTHEKEFVETPGILRLLLLLLLLFSPPFFFFPYPQNSPVELSHGGCLSGVAGY